MTPLIGSAEAIHSPGGITLGIFTDQGWTAAPAPCTYTLSATSATAPPSGAVGATINVTANPGCAWTAVSNSPGMITLAGGTTGNPQWPGPLQRQRKRFDIPRGNDDHRGPDVHRYARRSGSNDEYGQGRLQFGATTSGTFVAQTGAQIVRMTQSGAGTVRWTATSTQPWLQVSPASGTGSANLSITVVAAAGFPASGTRFDSGSDQSGVNGRRQFTGADRSDADHSNEWHFCAADRHD